MAEARQWLPRRRLVFAAVALALFATGWWFSAYPRGMVAAWADGSREHHEVQVYGLPFPWDGEYARLLRERYGVRLNFVAGCVVTQDLVWYVGGYNAVAEPRIRARFGKDSFAECAEEARTTWEAAHPGE